MLTIVEDIFIRDEGVRKEFIYFHAELAGQAVNTIGQFAKASDIASTANPSGKALTSAAAPGLNTGGTVGYYVPFDGTIEELALKFAAAAVGTGTVGTPTLRIRFYRQNYSTRTQIGADVDISVNTTGIGINDVLTGDGFQFVEATDLAIPVSKGDLISWEFVNQAASNNGINSVSRLASTVKVVAS